MAFSFNFSDFSSFTPLTTFSTADPVPGFPRRRGDDDRRPGFGLFMSDGGAFSSPGLRFAPAMPRQSRSGGGSIVFGIELSQTVSYVDGEGQVQVNGSIRVTEGVLDSSLGRDVGLVSQATQTVATPTFERPPPTGKQRGSIASESVYSQEEGDDVVDAGKERTNITGAVGARSSTGSGWVEIEVEEMGGDQGGVREPDDDEMSVLGYYTNRESRATIMQTVPVIEEADDEPFDNRYGGRRDAGRRRYL